MEYMDIDKYFERIGYNGPKDNSSSTLANLCECNSKTVPFEDIDMFGGERKRLDLQKVYRDIVLNKRGGFCYELNGLFHWLLEKLGFEIKIFQSQAYLKETDSYKPEFDHMTMLVTCNDGSKWLTDIGWGVSSFKTPLKFEENLEQTQRNGIYRLLKYTECVYIVQKRVKRRLGIFPMATEDKEVQLGEKEVRHPWTTIYKLDTTPRQWSDFELMCDYQQDNDASFFKHNNVATVNTDSGDLALWGWIVRKKIYIDPLAEETVLVEKATTQEELRILLSKYFGINVNFTVNVTCKDIKPFKAEIFR